MSARRQEALFSVRVQTLAARLRESEGLASFVGLVPVELLNRLLMELGVVFREGDPAASTPHDGLSSRHAVGVWVKHLNPLCERYSPFA